MKRFLGTLIFGVLALLASVGLGLLLIVCSPLVAIGVACTACFHAPWLWVEEKPRGRKGVRS